jgi:hypothetical protein
MNSTKIALALCLGSIALATTGCGKSKALQAVEEYQAAACACKDTACATAATTKYAARSADMATASSGEAEAITKATSAATECVTKLAMAGVPGMPAMPKK